MRSGSDDFGLVAIGDAFRFATLRKLTDWMLVENVQGLAYEPTWMIKVAS